VKGEPVPAEFDIEYLAEQAVDLLSVEAGQVIWIWASTHSLDLITALAFHIRSHGAFWTLRLISEQLLQRIGLDLPEQYMSLIPQHELRWMDDIDGIIEVHDHGGHIPGVEIARRRAMAAEWIALLDETSRRGIRHISICNPTPALADAYGVSLDILRQRYWNAINIDSPLLDRRMERIASLLSRASQVRITSPLGTDLTFHIDERPVYQDKLGLPRGEVYLAPHEDSAKGTVVIDQAFVRGHAIQRLKLTFEAGRLVDIQAPEAGAADSLRELLDVSGGDKDLIAEFALGLNPGANQLTGDIRLDEKIYGSAHIAIGANDSFGGCNRSNLHLDLVILHPTVWVDGQVLLDNDLFWLGHRPEDSDLV
jgi:leucyl aminopeptidase (aminopeptidase T)